MESIKPEDIDESIIKSFIKHLKIPYKARDYQISSILSGARKCRSLFVCPTASGKSLIIYGLTRWCHSKNLKTLILVPTTSLVEQMYSDFLDYGKFLDNNLKLIPVGGISKKNIKKFFENGSYGVGMGRSLFSKKLIFFCRKG